MSSSIAGSLPKKSFRIIRTIYIKELQVFSISDNTSTNSSDTGDTNNTNTNQPEYTDLPPVNVTRIRAKEETTISNQRQRLGVGVTQEAQDIFNALAKTLPVRWDNKEIVVLDDVRIVSPYNINNCNGGSVASRERVQKVLEGEKRRLMKKDK